MTVEEVYVGRYYQIEFANRENHPYHGVYFIVDINDGIVQYYYSQAARVVDFFQPDVENLFRWHPNSNKLPYLAAQMAEDVTARFVSKLRVEKRNLCEWVKIDG